MAEIKTGIFAKNVQKRLNRAQEKVRAACDDDDDEDVIIWVDEAGGDGGRQMEGHGDMDGVCRPIELRDVIIIIIIILFRYSCYFFMIRY